MIPDSLLQKFRSAPYAYFGITNHRRAKTEFLESKDSEPSFQYRPTFNEAVIAERIADLEALKTKAVEDDDTARFVERRLQETKFLQILLKLRADPLNQHVFEEYRKKITAMYGSFDDSVFYGILAYLKERSQSTETTSYFNDIVSGLGEKYTPSESLYRPSDKTFEYYRSVILTSDHPLKRFIEHEKIDVSKRDVMEAFEWALNESGAKEAGWKIRQSKAISNVLISRHKREIIVGKHYIPRAHKRLLQVVAHEVIIHTRRAMHHDSRQSADTEEGIALLAEQLIMERFTYKRLLRYFAAGLAWGVDGKPRTFRQTFDLVWRAVMIVGALGEMEAKERAYQECFRVFRGGAPFVAGAAFIKDKVYLESNLAVWQQLEDAKLGKQAFLDFLDGYK